MVSNFSLLRLMKNRTEEEWRETHFRGLFELFGDILHSWKLEIPSPTPTSAECPRTSQSVTLVHIKHVD